MDLKKLESPDNLTPLQAALWHDARGQWQRAHELAQAEASADGSHVHGYLHRKEGDDVNAGYWYDRAGVSFPTVNLDEEWEQLAAKHS